MALVKITSPVKHDGVLYLVGDECEVKRTADAERLERLDVAVVLEADTEKPDYTKMTNAELKALLDEKDIAYEASAVKADLIALLQE